MMISNYEESPHSPGLEEIFIKDLPSFWLRTPSTLQCNRNSQLFFQIRDIHPRRFRGRYSRMFCIALCYVDCGLACMYYKFYLQTNEWKFHKLFSVFVVAVNILATLIAVMVAHRRRWGWIQFCCLLMTFIILLLFPYHRKNTSKVMSIILTLRNTLMLSLLLGLTWIVVVVPDGSPAQQYASVILNALTGLYILRNNREQFLNTKYLIFF